MFCETVVLLSRETNPLTVEVRMEVETGEVKEHPTYKRIQEYVQEKYGFPVASIVSMAEVTEYLYNREVQGRVVIDDAVKTALDAYYEQYGAKE